jgi:uncharacterized protein (DUF3084 family)
MDPYSREYSRAVGMQMLNADKATGGGGTLKEQLQAAEQERDGFKADLGKEQSAHQATQGQLSTITKERDDAKTELSTEKTSHATTRQQLTDVTKERDDLKSKDTTATGKAAEALAKNGIVPAVKDAPGNLSTENAADPVALWDEYAGASPTKQAQMRTTHGAKLDAAALAWDAAQKR